MKIRNAWWVIRKPLEGESDNQSEGASAVGTGNAERLAFMQRINDANDETRAGELQLVNDDETLESFTVRGADGRETALTDTSTPDPVAAAEIERLAAESGQQSPEPQVQTITRKINGRDVTRTLDQWLAVASKVEAADQYLSEAARLRQEQNQRTQASQEDPVTVATVEEDDLAYARAIQMGTEEEAAAAVRALRHQRPSLTKDDVARTIDERLTFNEAIQQYRKDFNDIVSDPVLNQLALETDRKLLAAGDKRPYLERYADIGNTLRTWANGLAAKRNPPPAPVPATKLDRKAAATPVPKAAASKAASTVEVEEDESVADIIAGIAASRGGPQWMNGPTTRQ